MNNLSTRLFTNPAMIILSRRTFYRTPKSHSLLPVLSTNLPEKMDADSLPPPRLERSSESVEAAAASARRLRLGSDPAYKEGFGANGDGSAEALPSSAATLHSSPRALQSSSASSFLSSSSSGMRGWLHKMQEREVNVLLWGGSGSRWEPRLFVLQGGSLQYYRGKQKGEEGNKNERRRKAFLPTSTIWFLSILPLTIPIFFFRGTRRHPSRHVCAAPVCGSQRRRKEIAPGQNLPRACFVPPRYMRRSAEDETELNISIVFVKIAFFCFFRLSIPLCQLLLMCVHLLICFYLRCGGHFARSILGCPSSRFFGIVGLDRRLGARFIAALPKCGLGLRGTSAHTTA